MEARRVYYECTANRPVLSASRGTGGPPGLIRPARVQDRTIVSQKYSGAVLRGNPSSWRRRGYRRIRLALWLHQIVSEVDVSEEKKLLNFKVRGEPPVQAGPALYSNFLAVSRVGT